MAGKGLHWRNSKQIQGVRNRITHALSACKDGVHITLEVGTAHSLIEICDQAIRTEKEHEAPEGVFKCQN